MHVLRAVCEEPLESAQLQDQARKRLVPVDGRKDGAPPELLSDRPRLRLHRRVLQTCQEVLERQHEVIRPKDD
eukprot:CAMPEP_0197932688 /NCGR_PEP_ID=MMETSP1439-20131203/108989_1 /TAXON_ID=66791 /ORGANISM="Gonyaulax spinifera, Strain CCMP409" /LENGTH=72 /DNA_ID=CAMNT_0043555487 /DNA_START=42 /DNA_END=257 /DNA_ORIENTATION=-